METVIHLVIECKSVYYIAYGLEISLNKTKQHLSHRPIIVMRLELTGLKIHEGIQQVCMAKTITFLSRNQQVLSASLFITIRRKHQLLKICTNLKFTNFSEKAISVIKWSKSKNDINPSHIRIFQLAGYMHQSYSLRILTVVAWSNIPVPQKPGPQGE